MELARNNKAENTKLNEWCKITDNTFMGSHSAIFSFAELQIRQGIEDNSNDNFPYFSMKTYVKTPR